MSREIKNKIKELKDKHFNASNRNWIRVTNGLSQRETLDKLQSQVVILEELIKGECEPETNLKCEVKYFELIQSYPGSCERGTRVMVHGTIVNFCKVVYNMDGIPKISDLRDDRYWVEFRWDDNKPKQR
jgi:hypothetical protein